MYKARHSLGFVIFKNMRELIIVYKAKSGTLNKSLDYLHKMFSPETYSCDLCRITHGNFGAKKEWTQLLNKLNMKVAYFYCDNLPKEIAEMECPSILVRENAQLDSLISAVELKEISLEKLILKLEQKLI